MHPLVLSATLKIALIVMLVAFLISSWNEVFEKAVFDFFGLDRESIWSWLVVSLCVTVLFIIVLKTLKIEAHELFGISELVDRILTGTREKMLKSGLKHYKVK